MPAPPRFRFPHTDAQPLMSARAHKVLVMIGQAGLGFVASLFLVTTTGVWNLKESAASHTLDMTHAAAKEAADVARINAKLQRLIDILCEPKRSAAPPYACTDPDAGSSANGDVAPRNP